MARAAERDKKRVTLRVDLHAAMLVERLPEELAMLGKHVAVALTQPLDKRR